MMNKKVSKTREPIWARAKILVKNKKSPRREKIWFILPYSARNRNRRLYLSISR